MHEQELRTKSVHNPRKDSANTKIDPDRRGESFPGGRGPERENVDAGVGPLRTVVREAWRPF
jgi:hypothetical protein